MNRLFNFSFALLVVVALFSCVKKKENNSDESGTNKKLFILPKAPMMLTSPSDRDAFLALHYFDNFDFKDTTLIHLPDVGEQCIIDFIALLPKVSNNLRDSAIILAFKKASVELKMYSYFWKTLDRYLNDPNSPVRNEDLYISTCKSIMKLPKVDEVITSNAAFNLKQALKNRTGMQAANFRFTLESGKRMWMKDLKGKYTLLFFYEPDCHTCIETKAFMRQSGLLHNLIESSVITVLAFYPQDDKQLWLQRLPECSQDWVNGYDPDGYFTEKQPYNLRAFPTFYLLDKEKKVLLKDAPIETILEYLQQNG
jgi:hypothetical protein